MRLLADECCDAPLVKALLDEGHDVAYVLTEMPGALDREVLKRAYMERRVLLTQDKDFGELTVRLGEPSVRIILLRFSLPEQHLMIQRTLELFRTEPELADGAFVVIEAERIRRRPLRSD
ncbi:hypothetical protein BH23BAC4_BH23BAC4_14210 [soil metagenome]